MFVENCYDDICISCQLKKCKNREQLTGEMNAKKRLYRKVRKFYFDDDSINYAINYCMGIEIFDL